MLMKQILSKYLLLVGILLIGLLALTACGKANVVEQTSDDANDASPVNPASPRPTLDDVDKTQNQDQNSQESDTDSQSDDMASPKPVSSGTYYVHSVSAKATRSGDRWLVNVFNYDVSQSSLTQEQLANVKLELSSTGRTSVSSYNPNLNCSKLVDVIKERKLHFGYDSEKKIICMSPNFDMSVRQTLQTRILENEIVVYAFNASTPNNIASVDVMMVMQ
jgi:hypothetical protein